MTPGSAAPENEPDNREAIHAGTLSRITTSPAVAALRRRALRWLHRYEDRPVVGAVGDLVRRDSDTAGPMLASATAFRLFLFFVPLLLVAVGVAGFVGGHIDAEQVSQSTGISGGLGIQIRSALHQSGRSPWLITMIGLFGMLTAGRSLSRVLVAASTSAWRLPLSARAPLRVVGAIAGLAAGIGMVAILVNRARHDLGVGVAGLSLGVAFAVYTVAWMIISRMLPRATEDPGALLPGAVVFGGVLTAMEAVSQFYLPDQFSRASELYGAIGATIVTLGWFFILGRAIVIAIELNAVIYERYGSVSTVVFSLPLLRALPRRSARLRRFFDLPPPT